MHVVSFSSDSTFYHLHVLPIPDPSIERKSHSWLLPAPGYPAIINNYNVVKLIISPVSMINVIAIYNAVYVPSLAAEFPAGFPSSELHFSSLCVLSHLAGSDGHHQALLL